MNNDKTLSDINLQLKSFKGYKLTRIKYKESGNSFLLVFSVINKDDIFSTIQLFNCFLFDSDSVFDLSIEEAFFKKPGVFVLEYCNRYGIDSENVFEFRLLVKGEKNIESHEIKSLFVGCERIAITESISGSSHFWGLP